MKIALMMENSQANKNAIILNELNAVADEKGFPVYNVGMSDEHDHHLTYIHLGIMASILLNSKAVDFVVTDSVGPVGIEVPRDRDGSFEPVVVRKASAGSMQ